MSETKWDPLLVPSELVKGASRAYAAGNTKGYERFDWKQKDPEIFRRKLARHFYAYLDGEEGEPGFSHLDAMAAHVGALLWFEENK